MTETEWATCGDPGAMLRAARPFASDRKMRLFAAACWFRTWADQMPAKTREVVELFIGHVDGTVSPGEWVEGFTAAGGVNLGKHFRLLICTDALAAAVESAAFAAEDVATQQAWDAVQVDVHTALGRRFAQQNRRSQFRDRAHAKERDAQAALVREVFGNSFRPVTFSPEWRTDTAVSLARGMYDSRDFGAMPILADALQDAGCEDEKVLTHGRDPQATHVRGCWVTDLVLGKE